MENTPDSTLISDPAAMKTVGQLRALVVKAGGLVVEQSKELHSLKERIAVLEAESWERKAVTLIKNLETFLNTQIASLPCESRVRTMDEDTWGTCMYYRDEAYNLIEEKWKVLRT